MQQNEMLPFNWVWAQVNLLMTQLSVSLADGWLWSLGAQAPGSFRIQATSLSVLWMNTLWDFGTLLGRCPRMPSTSLPGFPNLSLVCWYPYLRLLQACHLIFSLRSPPRPLLWSSPPSRLGMGLSVLPILLFVLSAFYHNLRLRRAFSCTCLF